MYSDLFIYFIISVYPEYLIIDQYDDVSADGEDEGEEAESLPALVGGGGGGGGGGCPTDHTQSQSRHQLTPGEGEAAGHHGAAALPL